MKRIILPFLICWSFLLFGQECQQPFSIRYTSISKDSLSMRWSDSNGPNVLGFQIAYQIRGTKFEDGFFTDTLPTKNAVLRNLRSGTQYDLYIKTICNIQDDSGWNGPFPFTTLLTNPTQCETYLALSDDNCDQGGETFSLVVPNNGILGKDLFVESVEVILEHPWLADLELILENPAGRQVTLSRFNGAAQDNFGIVTADCSKVTTFSANACQSIRDGLAPFRGVYQPITSLLNINDGSQAKGIWKIRVCDRSFGDKGVLRYFKINLVPELCEPITTFDISHISGTEATVNWAPPINCESLRIEYGPEGFQQGTGIFVQVNCKNKKRALKDLTPNTTYDVYLLGDCLTSLAAPSCKQSFTTYCDNATIVENFDNNELCLNSCNLPCKIDGHWINVSDDQTDWIVWRNSTDTDGTGPQGDINGNGNYLYVESSPNICDLESTAILQSKCIKVGTNPGCGLGFSYHILGNQPGNIQVNVSNNSGNTWQHIATFEDINPSWQRGYVSLDDYVSEGIILQIVGSSGSDIQGDVAIDQIELYGDIDFGLTTLYRDEDGDGYGLSSDSIVICQSIRSGYASLKGDCNDRDASIHPGQIETLCSGIDENCNGVVDDIATIPDVVVTSVPESCFGINDGSITLEVTGDFGPYELYWPSQDVYDNKLDGVGLGSYQVIITDNKGCSYIPPLFEVSAESKIELDLFYFNPASCTGRRNGSMVINPSGGKEPYSYQWSHGDTHSGFVIGLGVGKYVVTVTDADGCVAISDSVQMTARRTMTVTYDSLTHISCKGMQDGFLSVIAPDGVPPLKYTWQDGYNLSDRGNLGPGTYQILVEDSVFCQTTIAVEIIEPDALELSLVNIEPIRCHGDRNGSIRTYTQGGNAPYTYEWNTGATTDDIFKLSSNDYTLTVTDANGCTMSLDTINLEDPIPLQVYIDTVLAASCRLATDGAIHLDVEGGMAPYNFFWRGVDYDSLVLTNAMAGNYGFTVLDQNLCKASLLGIDIAFGNTTYPTNINTISPHLCPQENDAVIAVNIENIHPPYIYNWSNGIQHFNSSSKDTLLQIGSGTYQVTITDALGCISTSDILEIDKLPSFNHTLNLIGVNTCPYDSTGTATVNVAGGSIPYTYMWSNGQSSDTVTSLANGVYNVTVTDANECTYIVDDILMTSMSELAVDAQITNASIDKDDGKIALVITGAVPNTSVKWDDIDDQTLTRNNLAPGSYKFTIIDGLGCQISQLVEVSRITSLNDIKISTPTLIHNKVNQSLAWVGSNIVNWTIYDIRGQLISTAGSEQELHLPSHMMNGLYIVSALREDGLILSAKFMYVK